MSIINQILRNHSDLIINTKKNILKSRSSKNYPSLNYFISKTDKGLKQLFLSL